jgi:cell division protein FtsA
MIGRKNPDGTLQVLAKDVEETKDCMRRGCIKHVDEATLCIRRLVLKLENIANKNKASGHKVKIEKVYIGVGGQSLHAIEHSVARIIPAESTVTNEDMQLLHEQCRENAKGLEEEVLSILPPVYYLDGKFVDNPLGAKCLQLKASYKLIVGRPLIRTSVAKAVSDAGLGLAGIIVSPLALADILLGPEEKKSGCILIYLGFGVTPVAVYKNNSLACFAVVPFGHHLITKDLAEALNLSEAEAEALKNDYANVSADKNKTPDAIEYIINGHKLDKHRTDMVAGARAREIVENVHNLVKTEIQTKPFGGSVKLMGEASELKGMDDLIVNLFKLKVVHASVPREWSEMETGDLVAVSLLTKGTENCVAPIPVVAPTPPPVVTAEPVVQEEEEDTKNNGKLDSILDFIGIGGKKGGQKKGERKTEENTGKKNPKGPKVDIGKIAKGLFDD